MSLKHNPRLIGLFVAMALLLFVGMVLFFGSTRWFTQSARFILFFDQSVNGLDIGSPVKFRGVPVGAVEQILIRAEGQREDSNAIPVLIRIDRSSLQGDLGVSSDAFSAASIQQAFDRGLVGQLNLESVITGQLFVELSFAPEAAEAIGTHLQAGADSHVEIPTLGSSLDQITADVAQLIADAGDIDLGRLNENANRVLENLATVLGGIDSEGISTSVTTAADEVSAFIRSETFKESIASLRRAFEAFEEVSRSFDLEKGSLGERMETWTRLLDDTLGGLNQLVSRTNALMAPDSRIRFEIEDSLRELSRAAASLRELTDYLERNPNALITGRREGKD